jgi:hypothetical protein
MRCGAQKAIDGSTVRLVCLLEAGHPLPHQGGIATWPVRWTAQDQQALLDRHGWRKPHVRRAYQTLPMWKAGR